jgi:DNA helicase-2/ATP-dependent DNA helicase PcrA
MIECLDPANNIDTSRDYRKLPDSIKTMIRSWRLQAQTLTATNHTLVGGITLENYVDAWKTRIPIGEAEWRRESSILELAYHLVSWIPEMQDDIEGLVYLEVILRTISQSSVFSSFKGKFIHDIDNPGLEEASVKDAIWSIFVPLATGVIEVNEDLLDTIPRNRIPIMSIHQAKGLQFPLVIVDVGSDFKIEHPTQRFKRYPVIADKSCRIEDALRNYSELGVPLRMGIDRCFDNLIRLYFVAYSRPQDVLILVGLNNVRDGYYLSKSKPGDPPKVIPHIATGWTRRRQWIWERGLNRFHHYRRG